MVGWDLAISRDGGDGKVYRTLVTAGVYVGVSRSVKKKEEKERRFT